MELIKQIQRHGVRHCQAILFGLLIVAAMQTTTIAGVGDRTALKPDNLFDLSLEELMAIPVVVSASRTEQKITHSAVPVSIITADDIHYGGMTNLADILQFTPGVDVLQLSRIRSAIGVRGLHEYISDRTLTLINGRAADNLLFGGSEFYRMPLLVEDIERIEIVRGPGGAAWGANAFTGVFNIITKKPGQTPGWLLSTTVTHFGDTYNHIRWMDKKDQWGWRVSAGFENIKNSERAGQGHMFTSNPSLNPLTGFPGYRAMDQGENIRLDTEFEYSVSDQTTLSFGVGYSHLERGDWEFLGSLPGTGAWYETVRNFAKIDHDFDNGSRGYLQWTGNFSNAKQPSLFKYFTMENELEAQYNVKASDHNITLGGNFKWIHINAKMLDEESIKMVDAPYNETFAGLFIIDRYDVTDALSLEAQLRSDWYSETHWDWSTRLSALYALDQAHHNIVRFSFAKAYRSPYASPRQNEVHRLFHPLTGTYVINVIPENKLRNEETWALEAGYSARLTDLLSFRVDAYYQRFEHLIAYEAFTGPTMIEFIADNVGGADSWGIETELAMENKDGKLSLWHAYNDFSTDISNQPLRGYKPAMHKTGLTGRLFLPDGLTLNANYRYKTVTNVEGETTIFSVPSDHRLDMTVSKRFANNGGEWLIGVSDVFNKARDPVWTLGSLSSFETPGRTFFARLQLYF